MQALTTLEKLHEDQRLYSFDFSLQPEILAGDGISGANLTASPTDGNLVIGSLQIASPQINVYLSEGAPGTTYLVTCEATTDGVATGVIAVITALGKLYVVDPSTL